VFGNRKVIRTLCGFVFTCFIYYTRDIGNNNNNNNIYVAKGRVHKKGKSPSKLATILKATKEKQEVKVI